MLFQVTVTIGGDTTDAAELRAKADRLDKYYTEGPWGGASGQPSRPLVPEILVNPAGGTLIIVRDIDTEDALIAVMLVGGGVVSALMGADLARPTSITTITADLVPPSAQPAADQGS